MSDWPAWGYEGVHGYAAGTTIGTVDVPTDARLRRVSVVAGTAASCSIVIGSGGTIFVPSGYVFDEQLNGAAINKDVVITGTIQTYYVAWAV